MKFIQITDSHLLEGGNIKLHNIPINEIHFKIFSELKKIETEIEFILVTGDISENGSDESYLNAREIFSSDINFILLCTREPRTQKQVGYMSIEVEQQ